jgi:hypothetical protein
MQSAQWTPEAAFAELQQRFAELSSASIASNEADTRLKVINTILFNILDWHLSDAETEKYCRETGYADYVLSTHHSPCIVLEAKKAGISFSVPSNKFKTTPLCFALLEAETPEIGKALRQAQAYASSLGTRYVAITNGHQWLLTLTFVQSQSVTNRQVIFFDSLSCIRDHFRQFWQCFSQQMLSTNNVIPLLIESRKKPAPPKPSSSIAGYPVPSNRNAYVNELSSVLHVVWDVLSRAEGTRDFLDACYVPPATNEHLIAFAREVLSHRRQADDLRSHVTVAAATPATVQSTVLGYDNEKPFVILGDVGHGKTTFLNHLRLVAANDLFADYIQLEANFLDRPDSPDAVNDYIYREIEAQLLARYNIDVFNDSTVRGSLHGDIDRFRTSAQYILATTQADKAAAESAFIQAKLSDKHEYLTALFRHLKRGQQKSLTIFIDNLDRRDEQIQEKAFLKASAIARDWECIVFICLRPSTFYASLKKGLLDSLAPKTFTLGTPELAIILKRRFQFAQAVALGEVNTPILRDALQRKEIGYRLPTIAQFFGCCEFSTTKKSDAIGMLTAISNGNIRVLLEITRRMITSGHLDTRKIASNVSTGKKYFVPDFEAVKTLLYGDYDHYSAKYSLFVNLYDVYHADDKEHFLRPLALEYLLRFLNRNSDRCWVPRQDLVTYLECSYFDMATIERHLEVLVDAECVDVEDERGETSTLGSRLKISTRGALHVVSLIKDFQYIDAVCIDTPILDPDVAKLVVSCHSIDQRIERSRRFLAYLEKCCKSLADSEAKSLVDRWLHDQRESCSIVVERVQSSRMQ